MLFSIIVPVYNIQDYIMKCLNHVLNQTFSDYELILIDDGSTDDSGRICDEYAKRHTCIKVIHQKNHGQAYARNQGIIFAKGDYILFLDGDDYWYGRKCLQKLFQYITENKGCFDIIAYSGISAFSDGKRTIYSDKGMNGYVADDFNKGYTPQDFLKRHLSEQRSFYWYPCLYAFSKKLFEKYGLKFPNHRKYEDVYLVWRILLKADRIGVVQDIFYVYRRNRKNSTTVRKSYKNLSDFLWVIEQNMRDVKRKKMDLGLKKYLLNNFSNNYYTCCVSATYLDKKEKKKMIAKLKKKQWIMDYSDKSLYVLARTGGKIIGFNNMLRVLHMYDSTKRYVRKLIFCRLK